MRSFNEAEAVKPRIIIRRRRAYTGHRTGFNEAEAVKPRIMAGKVEEARKGEMLQ